LPLLLYFITFFKIGLVSHDLEFHFQLNERVDGDLRESIALLLIFNEKIDFYYLWVLLFPFLDFDFGLDLKLVLRFSFS
jgi:hypothetical protein